MSVTDAVYGVDTVSESLSIFTTAPVSWFVYLALVAIGVGMIAKIVGTRKKK